MEKQIMEQLKNDYINADMVVVGIGSGVYFAYLNNQETVRKQLQQVLSILDKKNYFIISSISKNIFENMDYNEKRLCNVKINDEKLEKQWDLYNKWLSATLNKKLLIIEIGEDFNNPNIFRWPFEKVTFINQKSIMYRVNEVFYQLPENIGGRAFGIAESIDDFFNDICMLLK